MRWILGAVLGIVGGVVAIVISSEPATRAYFVDIRFVSFVLGFVIGSPAGYFIGLTLDANLLKVRSKQERQKHSSEKVFAPQIVGSKCCDCDNRIMFITDARFCTRCNNVFHLSCSTNDACPSCGFTE